MTVERGQRTREGNGETKSHASHDDASISRGSFKDYVAIARPDHWVKHVFILPGIFLAALLVDGIDTINYSNLIYGFIAACLIASANYVINEVLDAAHDRFHPLKSARPAARGRISMKLALVQYVALLACGIGLSISVGILFAVIAALFALSGLAYNVPPVRLKEFPVLDVVAESFNSPLRLTLGWTMVSAETLPPLSLFLIFWFAGGFLMTVKRLAERRYVLRVSCAADLEDYRRVFARYSENMLIVQMFIFGMASGFFISAFLIKYKTEFILMFPLFIFLFSYYLWVGLKFESSAQTPERLHRDRCLVTTVLVLAAVFGLLVFAEIPMLEGLVRARFSDLSLPP